MTITPIDAARELFSPITIYDSGELDLRELVSTDSTDAWRPPGTSWWSRWRYQADHRH